MLRSNCVGGNCSDTSGSGDPRCADALWTLFAGNGYSCCPKGYICYDLANESTMGCGAPGYVLGSGEYTVSAFLASSPSASSTPNPTPSSSVTTIQREGLGSADAIAVGIGIPVGLATLIAAYYTWRSYRRGTVRTR